MLCHLKTTGKSALGVYALGVLFVGACFAHGDIGLRLEGATRQIDAQPADPELYLRRSRLHREHRDWVAAEADIAAARALNPSAPDLLHHRALLLRDRGELDAAADLLRRFLESGFEAHPGAVPRSRVHAELGQVLADLGERRRAADQLSLAIDHAKQPAPQLYISRAELLAKMGEPDRMKDALRGLDQGISRLGAGSILPDYAIDMEVNLGDYDGALERIEIRLQAPGYRLQALLKKAEILEMAGRREAALVAYKDAGGALDALPVRARSTLAMRRLFARVGAGIHRIENGRAFEAAGGGRDAVPGPS